MKVPGNWNVTKLGSILKLEYGKSLVESQRTKNGLPVYGSGGIIDHHQKHLVNGPGIIVARKGSIGNTFLSMTNFWPIDTVFYFNKKHTTEDLIFLYYLIQHLKLENLSILTARPGINREQVYQLDVAIPPINEQEKIASILSDVDLLIQRTKDIIESNQLLMFEFATKLMITGIGHTKFKKTKLGNIPENWEMKKLGEFTKTYRYPTFYDIQYRDKGVPVLNIGNIDNSTWKLSKNLNDYKKIDAKTSNAFNKTIVKEGDLVLAVRGATIGKCAVVPKILDSGNINANLLKLSFDKKICDPSYFWFYSQTKNGRKAFHKFVASTAKETVQSTELKTWSVVLPPLNEQEKILSNLKHFNLLLESELQYNSQLENLKKGLTQKLLTGQIRA